MCGTTSINGGSPLVLVDGVEMDLDMINPNDIANVTVLKDAAASAIYGVRAAYGVILVTWHSLNRLYCRRWSTQVGNMPNL